MTERPSGRTCRAKNRRGQPCKRVPRENGYCVVHDPVNPQDMRAAARLGGKARRRGVGEQLPVVEALSLRETLRSGLDHQLVKSAIEQALAGGNESARVAAVKFLADLELYRKDGDECPRCAAIKAEAPAAREKMAQMLEAQLVRAVQDHDAGKLNGEHDSRAMTMVRRAVARAREVTRPSCRPWSRRRC